MTFTPHKLTLVIGGAASGKSQYAEELVLTSGLPRSYIATAQAHDDEMRSKITKHQKRRREWVNFEEPTEPWNALARIPDSHFTMIDCATFWLSNLIFGEFDIVEMQEKLIAALHVHNGPVIVVTNELGMSVVPENKLAREFRQLHGEMNQRLAKSSDLVVQVTAGLPITLKGVLPRITR